MFPPSGVNPGGGVSGGTFSGYMPPPNGVNPSKRLNDGGTRYMPAGGVTPGGGMNVGGVGVVDGGGVVSCDGVAGEPLPKLKVYCFEALSGLPVSKLVPVAVMAS